jgi:hypothetical protein
MGVQGLEQTVVLQRLAAPAPEGLEGTAAILRGLRLEDLEHGLEGRELAARDVAVVDQVTVT